MRTIDHTPVSRTRTVSRVLAIAVASLMALAGTASATAASAATKSGPGHTRSRRPIRSVVAEPTCGTGARLTVGAGTAKRSRLGGTVRFDAGASVSSTPHHPLDYRWRIVSHPPGSRARLQGAHTSRPSLHPDRPGRYVLQVTVTERRSPATRAARKPTARRASGHLLCLSSGATATTSLSAAVSAGPLGVPIDTIASNGRTLGIQVGDSTTVGADFYPVPDPSRALQLLVLNRTTLALIENQSFSNDVAGAASLLSAVSALDDHTQRENNPLVIITRPDPGVTNVADGDLGDPTATASINKALASIGVSPVPNSVATGRLCNSSENNQPCGGCAPGPDVCSSFSAIGVPGIPVGQGDLAPGLPAPAGLRAAPGDLHGYLRQDLDNDQHYEFTDVERVPYDTGPADADPAVVTIGSDEPGSELPKHTYTSDTTLSGPGFFLLVLNAGTLEPEFQLTVPDTESGLRELSIALHGVAVKNPMVVILRSVGKVERIPGTQGANSWDTVADDLQRFGATQYYFNALNGTTSAQYAQVGPTGTSGYPSPWTQIASQERSGGGRLAGLLGRNPQGEFYPDESIAGLKDSDRPLAGTLPGIISLPTTTWPDRSTDPDKAVLACIAGHIDAAGPLATPIESNYSNENLAGKFGGWAAEVGSDYQKFEKACPQLDNQASEQDYDEVAGQLEKEWSDVDSVWSMIDNMQKPWEGDDATAEVQKAADNINQAIGSGDDTVHFDGMGFIEDTVEIAALYPGIEEVAAPFEALVYGMNLSSLFDLNPDGTSALPDVSIQGHDLAEKIAETDRNSITNLDLTGELLTSDWNKLQLAAANADNTTNAAADWGWTAKVAASTTDALVLAARRLTYTTLFPARFELYRLQEGTGNFPVDASQYPCARVFVGGNQGGSYAYLTQWQPFTNVSAYGTTTAQLSAEGAQEHWVFAGPDGFLDTPNQLAALPPTSLLQQMFADPQQDIGLDEPLFNPLEFALEAYQGGANAETVTHVKDQYLTVSTPNRCTRG